MKGVQELLGKVPCSYEWPFYKQARIYQYRREQSTRIRVTLNVRSNVVLPNFEAEGNSPSNSRVILRADLWNNLTWTIYWNAVAGVWVREEHPDDAVFEQRLANLNDNNRAAIYRAYYQRLTGSCYQPKYQEMVKNINGGWPKDDKRSLFQPILVSRLKFINSRAANILSYWFARGILQYEYTPLD